MLSIVNNEKWQKYLGLHCKECGLKFGLFSIAIRHLEQEHPLIFKELWPDHDALKENVRELLKERER